LPLYIFINDVVNFKCLWCNRSLENDLGYTSVEWCSFEGEELTNHIHPADSKELIEILEKLKTAPDGTVFDSEYRIRHKNGEWIWFESRVTAYKRDINNTLTEVLGAAQNISKRKKAEIELRESEAKYRTVIERVNDTIYTIANDGTVKTLSPAFERVTGWKAEEYIGHSFLELIHKDEWQHAFEIHELIQQGITPPVFEHRFCLKSGEYADAEFSVTPLIEQGKVVGTLGIARNITLRKQAEEAIRQNEKKFRELAELLPEVVFEINLQGILIFINKRAYEIFGYTQAEIEKGFSVFTAIDDNDKVRAFENFRNVGQKSEISGNEYLAVRKDGSKFPCRIYSEPIFKGAKLTGARGILVDITEQKQAEEQLKLYAAELKETSAAKDKLFSIIGHDLRNPFNTIINLSNLLSENISPSHLRLVRMISEHAKKAHHLLENLLEWARNQQGLLKVTPKRIDLNILVGEVISLLSVMARNKNISLASEVGFQKLVFVDEYMISTVVRNLISNALKFTPQNGKIHITAQNYIEVSNNQENITSNHDFIEICISDTGIGLRHDDITKLFRLDVKNNDIGTEMTDEKGSGLGLILCKEFVEYHGGKIWVESQYSKGSQFKFTLPKFKL